MLGAAIVSTLLASCYAAARKHLAKARTAQSEALYGGLGVYRGGRVGKDARSLRDRKDREHADHLAEALRIRAKIRELRAELLAIESDIITAHEGIHTDNTDTDPPRAA